MYLLANSPWTIHVCPQTQCIPRILLQCVHWPTIQSQSFTFPVCLYTGQQSMHNPWMSTYITYSLNTSLVCLLANCPWTIHRCPQIQCSLRILFQCVYSGQLSMDYPQMSTNTVYSWAYFSNGYTGYLCPRTIHGCPQIQCILRMLFQCVYWLTIRGLSTDVIIPIRLSNCY